MKNLNSKNVKQILLTTLTICTLCLFSCKSNAQEHKEKEKTHKEGKGHDKDGKNHGKEVKGHDNDSKHKSERGEHNESREGGEHNEGTKTIRGEHSRDKGGEVEGEEDGTQLSLDATYDVTKHGVHLVLKYNKASNSFVGYMENGTDKVIEKARVEVHLSNGTELGPTTPITLAPKMKKEIVIKATEASFDGWSTHAEIGNLEHAGENGEGYEGKEKGEHDGEKGEHQ